MVIHVICYSRKRRIHLACEVNSSFSGVTYICNHVFIDTKSKYLFCYTTSCQAERPLVILPVTCCQIYLYYFAPNGPDLYIKEHI